MPHATDVLANERTFLAYIRTALAFIAFGFVIARFSLFAQEFAALIHGRQAAPGLSTTFGTAMAVFGIGMALLGAWRYSVTEHALREERVVSLPSVVGYVISILVAMIGAVVAFALMLYR
jgi:putative membrane protein